jgi:hypothetical protein
MVMSNTFFQIGKTEPYQYAQLRGVTTNFNTAPPPHKGFAINTGATSGASPNQQQPVTFDLLYRNSNGTTFTNRLNLPIGSTYFFPMQISGISANPIAFLDPTTDPAGLNAHLVYYYS